MCGTPCSVTVTTACEAAALGLAARVSKTHASRRVCNRRVIMIELASGFRLIAKDVAAADFLIPRGRGEYG
jgi:uncharacterized membrane protein